MDLTAPTFLTATCPECSAQATFEMAEGDPDEAKAEYDCEACGHTVALLLDP